MSSPLSMLGKNRRPPLPGASSQQGRSRVPFKDNPLAEYEAALLRDLGPCAVNPPQPQATGPAATKTKATQRNNSSNGAAAAAAPSDFELMTSMMQRLTLLEGKVRSQALDLDRKMRKIAVLEEKLALLQKLRERSSGRGEEHDLIRTCHRLQAQVWEMERFLSDYGMIWVGGAGGGGGGGGGKDCDTAQQQEVEAVKHEKNESTEGGLWQPETSLVRIFQMNFDLVLRNIRELNILAGEGESFVRATPRGAELARQATIPLRLYSNGIFMFDGPFRSYEEPSTQQCMRDLMDGYFPTELQERFPDGVPFQAQDRREEEFKQRRPWEEFPGKGQAVVGATEAEQPPASSRHAHSTSQAPGRQLSLDQFLSRLPKVVMRAGRVIDIRDSVRANLQGPSDTPRGPEVTLIDTPVLQAMKERLELHKADRPASARDVTTLRVRSEDGELTYILKMRFSETIGHLRRYLDTHRRTDVPGYDIISAFPQCCYSDDSRTLLSCGLTPNAALLLRQRPR